MQISKIIRSDRFSKSAAFAVGLVVGLGFLSATPAQSESLTQALTSAYLNNPTLRAARASVRATDETVNQALSGWRPTIRSDGDYGRNRADARPGGLVKTKPHGAGIGVTQPIFRGFRTINNTRRADADVSAARQDLISVEQTTLLETVTAFMNVMRDAAIVGLRIKNVAVLKEQLRASQARFSVGEITRTDVAQSSARLSGAESDLSTARANLASSRAEYARVVGNPAGSLRNKRSIAKLLPRTYQSALATARKRNPVLLAATYNEKSSSHAIDSAKGELLPEVSLEARHDRRYNLPSGFINRTDNSSIIGRVDVPLYQSGAEYSRIRQAQQVNSQRLLQIREAERSVRAATISAWEALRASRQSIQADQAQVSANELALRGVRQEAKVGSRTTLDVLDAEQELLDSRVSLVTARRNEVVAGYSLLAAIGRLTVQDLRLPVKAYDPTKHYDAVRDKWIGYGPQKP